MMIHLDPQHARISGMPPTVPTNKLPDEPSRLPPVVINPAEVETINIQLEKNQQCCCQGCGKIFNSVWYLKQHAVKHSNERPFRCQYCKKTYKFRSNLYQHKCPDRIKNENTTRPYINHSVMFNGNLARMIPNTTRNIRTFGPYDNIGEQPTSSEYSENMKERSVEDRTLPVAPLSEPKKLFTLPRRKPLNEAAIERFLERYKHKLSQCRKCRQQFPSQEYLNRHMAYHMEEELLAHKCDFCPQRFSTEKNLRLHNQLHTSDATIRCTRCSACFSSCLALRRHKDGCRGCRTLPFGVSVDDKESASSAIDEYAFIDANEIADNPSPMMNEEENIGNGDPDSGLGSVTSNHAFSIITNDGSESSESEPKTDVTKGERRTDEVCENSLGKSLHNDDDTKRRTMTEATPFSSVEYGLKTNYDTLSNGELSRSISSSKDVIGNFYGRYTGFTAGGNISNVEKILCCAILCLLVMRQWTKYL